MEQVYSVTEAAAETRKLRVALLRPEAVISLFHFLADLDEGPTSCLETLHHDPCPLPHPVAVSRCLPN